MKRANRFKIACFLSKHYTPILNKSKRNFGHLAKKPYTFLYSFTLFYN